MPQEYRGTPRIRQLSDAVKASTWQFEGSRGDRGGVR